MMSRNILKSAAAFIILAALVATIQAAPTADKLAGQQQQQTDASDTREFQLFGDDQRPSPLRRQQQLLSNYEQDIAALVRAAAAAKRQQVRIQRSLASQASQQASLVPVQRLFEDEQEFKRQLPVSALLLT